MAPKQSKMSSPSSGGAGYEQDINQDDQNLVEEILIQFIYSENFLSEIASSSEVRLEEVLTYLESKVDVLTSKLKVAKAEKNQRIKMATKEETKAKAKARAENEKLRKAELRTKSFSIHILFNGQDIEVLVRRGMTVGAIRKLIIMKWNEMNPDRQIALLRSSKLSLLHDREKLHIRPRATIGTFGFHSHDAADLVFHASFMADEDDDATTIQDGEEFDENEEETDADESEDGMNDGEL